jgi:hypothetical protein
MTTEGPVLPIRAERKGQGRTVVTMAKKLRDAAGDPQRDVPNLECIRHNIYRWESGGCGVSERYRYLDCRVPAGRQWRQACVRLPKRRRGRRLSREKGGVFPRAGRRCAPSFTR